MKTKKKSKKNIKKNIKKKNGGGQHELKRSASSPARVVFQNNNDNYSNSNINSSNSSNSEIPLFEIYYFSLFGNFPNEGNEFEIDKEVAIILDQTDLKNIKPKSKNVKLFSPFIEYQCWNIYYYLRSSERDRNISLIELKKLIETQDVNFFLPGRADLSQRNLNIKSKMLDKKRFNEAINILRMHLTSYNSNN